jgi:dolichol-phosphate mannosyltransferase
MKYMEKMQSHVVVIIPTYNECESIQILLKHLQKIFNEHPKYIWTILVVDSFSPDRTGEYVRLIGKKFPNIKIIDQLRQGIGMAYQGGFKWVMKNIPSANFIIQMDGDLSHDPQKIIHFLETAEKGYDVVIGSRYIPNGKWVDVPFSRNIISRGGNALARSLGKLTAIRDCTSGYRCIRKYYVEKTLNNHAFFSGHAFQIQFLGTLISSGARIAEIPIQFQSRKHGFSKLKIRDFWESIVVVFELWKKRK